MKKKLAMIICACLVSAAIFCVSADTYDFEFNVSGSTTVETGKDFTYTFTLDNVKVDGGIMGFDCNKLEFDTSILTYKSSEVSTLSGWDIGIKTNDAANGKIEFHAVNEGNASTPKNGKIKFIVTFTVAETEATSTTISLDNVVAVDKNLGEVNTGKYSNVSLVIKHTLATPTNNVWEDTVAKWDSVANASSYIVQLFKDGEECGDAVESTATQYDFNNLTDGGRYTFTVTAISDSEAYGDSKESSKSADRIVKGKLGTPSVKLSANLSNGGLKYQITDTNDSSSVSKYFVTIYNGEIEVKTIEISSSVLGGNIQLDDKIIGGTSYSASIVAKSKDSEINDDSDASTKCTAVEAAKAIDSIAFDNAPETSYFENTAINLSNVTILITYSDKTSVTIGYKDFETYGIEFNVDDGQTLTLDDNGLVIQAVIGSGSSKKTASSAKITVSKSTCSHSNTHIEKQNATCGADGYESVICSDCGATITKTIIPATNEHSFGDWHVTMEPTASRKGLKERVCSVCEFSQAEEIPATGKDTSNDTKDSKTTTAEETTKPEAVTDVPSKMDDLTKIFFVIVIVIFVIIIFIIIVSIALEKKRARERRRRAAQRARRRPPMQ